MSINYSFSIDDAIKHGQEEAILLANIRFWILKNQANDKHFYEGRYWTYNSVEAFSELFPFWTPKQIRRIIDSLIDQKVLIVGNFNNSQYNRTRWFSLTEMPHLPKSTNGEKSNDASVNSNCPNENIHLPKQANLLTDNKPDINTNKNNNIQKENIKRKSLNLEKDDLFTKWWQLYPNKIGKKHAQKAWSKLTQEEMEMAIIAIDAQIQERNYKEMHKIGFIPEWKHPTTWLNAGSWEDEVKTENQIQGERNETVIRNTQRNAKLNPVEQLRIEQYESLTKKYGTERANRIMGNRRPGYKSSASASRCDDGFIWETNNVSAT